MPKFSAAARQRLELHPWPGNVRELRNLMERVAFLTTGEKVETEDLAFIIDPNSTLSPRHPSDRTLADATVQFQIDHIKQAIERARGNMSEAANLLGLHRSNALPQDAATRHASTRRRAKQLRLRFNRLWLCCFQLDSFQFNAVILCR